MLLPLMLEGKPKPSAISVEFQFNALLIAQPIRPQFWKGPAKQLLKIGAANSFGQPGGTFRAPLTGPDIAQGRLPNMTVRTAPFKLGPIVLIVGREALAPTTPS
jgi:hypothetical protein